MNPSTQSQNHEVEPDALGALGHFSGFVHLFHS